ncbi:hypothetical protein BJA01nite_13190 [Bradyrhizobium japonicum]|nr:hypothetical protein BJA01nite_13190 [Bradyrhizobium japonicum]
MAFEHHVALRPNGAGIHLILRLKQRNDDIMLSFENLPNMGGPAAPEREVAGMDHQARTVSRPVLRRDDFMTRDQEKDIPARQLGLLLHEFDIVRGARKPRPLFQMGVDRV